MNLMFSYSFLLFVHPGDQFIYSGNRGAVYGLSCNYCYIWSYGFLQATNVSLYVCLFINWKNVILTMLSSILTSSTSTCRNDDEEKAFSSFLNLSRFPQVPFLILFPFTGNSTTTLVYILAWLWIVSEKEVLRKLAISSIYLLLCRNISIICQG